MVWLTKSKFLSLFMVWLTKSKFLSLGYERDLPELWTDFRIGLQYYLEEILDYTEYQNSLPPGAEAKDQKRHVLTMRLTKMLMNQNLTLSLFIYYSPSDADAYLRPNLHYKIDDSWSAFCGGNIFAGNEEHTFFGQFEKNSNLYVGLRYGY